MMKPGDHVIASNDLYGGSYRLFTQVFQPYGVDYTFVDMSNMDEVEAACTDQTKMIWIETPTNPLLRVVDIEALTDFAKTKDIISVVDNTFASPYLQNPLNLGADAVLHSTTKYLGGHSDIIGGAIATSDDEILEHLRFQQKTTGAIPGPMDCYLTLRGIKTLAVRVERATENAKKIARFLEDHDAVGNVRYPGLESHPQHEIAKKQMNDFGAMVSFTLKDDTMEEAQAFMTRTHYFTLAESLGGVESLISHPASMTHGSIPKEEREKAGLKDSLIRLSVGIEDVDDLIQDLEKAFA
jgi:cystathionine beta-lyase/cystathionine gamma-synthase